MSAITLGIIVDDTIHLLYHYQCRTLNAPASHIDNHITQSVTQIGMPILITTLVLSLGLLTLTLSKFKPNAELGLLATIVMIAAVIIDLLYLPSIIKLGRYKYNDKSH